MILNIAQRSEKNNNSKKGCEQVCMGGWGGGGEDLLKIEGLGGGDEIFC